MSIKTTALAHFVGNDGGFAGLKKELKMEKEVLEEMCKARMAITKMRAATRDNCMEGEKAKKLNRLVRDMIELIAQFEGEYEQN